VLLPWSSKGLIEFAKTGRVTALDETVKNFVPQYFKIFESIGRFNINSRFVNDLSKVSDEHGNNLLYLAVKFKRSLDVGSTGGR
jgi:hypothetical protein